MNLHANQDRPGRRWTGVTSKGVPRQSAPAPIVKKHTASSCALDACAESPHGLERSEVGTLLGICAEAVRLIELRGLQKLRAAGITIDDFDEPEHREPIEEAGPFWMSEEERARHRVGLRERRRLRAEQAAHVTETVEAGEVGAVPTPGKYLELQGLSEGSRCGGRSIAPVSGTSNPTRRNHGQ